MQDRLRQILEEQMPYIGQGALVGGKETHKKRVEAAACNPWINFLQHISENCNIPYGDAMRDDRIKKLYKQEYNGPICRNGKLMGGEEDYDDMMGGVGPTCWTKFRKANAGKIFLEKGNKNMDRHYQNYLKKTGCKVGVRKKVGSKRKVARRTTKKKAIAKRGTYKSKIFPGKSEAYVRNILKKCIGHGM
jgi:hypothetical protein